MRTLVLIDGFNVYHALDAIPEFHKYKWLNYEKLASVFVQSQDTIAKVTYFTAYAYWNEAKEQRHRTLVKALRLNNIEIVFGKFKIKDRKCPLCKRKYQTYEEKMTDVNIAIYLFRAAVQNRFEKAILITGDTDLVPAITTIKEVFPNKLIGVVIPIGRKAKELHKVADFHRKMRPVHLASCRFPETIN
ncbi:MAG: NYN domain-containing protein, partial [Deltaproteobacteria bacterium]|nr:NYN domain-containing protein [Deltaproteobacteria bacterium]